MELFKASNQWATRPDDERFETMDQIITVTKAYAEQARQKEVNWSDLRVESAGNDLNLIGRAGVPAQVSNWAFGQLCARTGSPASYLRTLPGTLAAQNLNHGLKNRIGEDKTAQLLFHTNGSLILRAATSEMYSRIWNHEVAERVQELAERFNMVPAHATFSWDGKDVSASGLQKAIYASDHDMFLFLMSQDKTLQDNGSQLRRGFFVWNSEVGGASLGISRFLFRDVCFNHIVWGAEGLMEVRLIHKGKIREKWGDIKAEVRKYLDSSANDEQNAIYAAQQVVLGDTKEAVLDKLFGIRKIGLPRKTLEAAYNAVKPEEDGSPNSAWGFVQGVTRHSQTVHYADDRTALDRAAGKILEATF